LFREKMVKPARVDKNRVRERVDEERVGSEVRLPPEEWKRNACKYRYTHRAFSKQKKELGIKMRLLKVLHPNCTIRRSKKYLKQK